MSTNGEHDGDRTSPDLGEHEEHTVPGVGTGDAFISITSSADRIVAALRALVDSCPPSGAAGRRRHLEVLALNFGELGELAHDARRVTLQLIREEYP